MGAVESVTVVVEVEPKILFVRFVGNVIDLLPVASCETTSVPYDPTGGVVSVNGVEPDAVKVKILFNLSKVTEAFKP